MDILHFTSKDDSNTLNKQTAQRKETTERVKITKITKRRTHLHNFVHYVFLFWRNLREKNVPFDSDSD